MSMFPLLHTLRELSNTIAFGASLEDVFDTTLRQMVPFMEADSGSIQLLTCDNTLRTVATYGELNAALHDALSEFAIDDAGYSQVFASDHALVIHQPIEALAIRGPLSSLLHQDHIMLAVLIALKVKGKSIGIFSMGYKSPHAIHPMQLAWFEVMANLVSISLYNAQLLADLRAKQVALQDAWAAVTDAQEGERQRLSRELHDDVGQALTSLMLRLKALQSETDIETISDRLNGLRYLTGQTLEEVRRISMDLRPVVLDELGLVPAVRAYVRERADWAKIDISFQTEGSIYTLRPDLEIACYRAVQEGLTNIIRHSRASEASVRLAYADKGITITIWDNGIGAYSPSSEKGVGLVGMQERAWLLGGAVTIATEPGAGFTLKVELPNSA